MIRKAEIHMLDSLVKQIKTDFKSIQKAYYNIIYNGCAR